MDNIFFGNWESVFRTIIITVLAYIALIFLLRSSGKRTLSKMNAFDFIVTIALGSCLATVALNKKVVLIEGVLVFFLLIFMQYFITWLSVRIKSVKNIITSKPAMLLYKGELFDKELKKQRVTIEEIHTAARRKGFTDLDKIDVIVLETTGDITVVGESAEEEESLKTIKNYNKNK